MAGGQTGVVITGTGLSGATSVTFGGNAPAALEGRVKITPAVSIVVPLYNEEESLPLLHNKIRVACEHLEIFYEIVGS